MNSSSPNSFYQTQPVNPSSLSLGDMFDTAPPALEESETHRLRTYHLSLLRRGPGQQGLQEARTAPIFTMPVLAHVEMKLSDDPEPPFPQYGLLAGLTKSLNEETALGKALLPSQDKDPRIFFNVASPSSTFICGSQGSGKSHTLSCLLENCLAHSDASTPLDTKVVTIEKRIALMICPHNGCVGRYKADRVFFFGSVEGVQ